MSSQDQNTSNRGEIRLTVDIPDFNGKLTPATMAVTSFTMDEAVNDFYRLDVVVGIAWPHGVSGLTQAALLRPLVLRMDWAGGARTVGGRIAEIESLGLGGPEGGKRDFYRFTVRPNFWFVGQTRRSRIFAKLTPKDLLHKVFADYDGKQDGNEIDPADLPVTCRIDGGAPSPSSSDGDPKDQFYRQLIHQRDESDAEFVLRWLERMGWHMAFRWEDTASGAIPARLPYQEETLVIFTEPESNRKSITLNAATQSANNIGVLRHQSGANPVPKKFIMQDYNPDYPNVTLTGQYPKQGSGDAQLPATLTDEFFDKADEGNALAQIRYETAQCHAARFRYETNSPAVAASGLVKHAEGDNALDLFVTGVHHEAVANNAAASVPGEVLQTTYANRFEAVLAEKPFHPVRARSWPRLAGVVEGWVLPYKEGAVEAVTDKGRYHVYLKGVLPLAKEAGKPGSTTPLFMGQSAYSYRVGESHPLYAGTPVAVAFRDGNPDRPFIAHAMPNYNDLLPHVTNIHSVLSHSGGLQLQGTVTDWGSTLDVKSGQGNMSVRNHAGVSTVENNAAITSNNAFLTMNNYGPFQNFAGTTFSRMYTETTGLVGSLIKLGLAGFKGYDGYFNKCEEIETAAGKETIQGLDFGMTGKLAGFVDLANLFFTLQGWEAQRSRVQLDAVTGKSSISEMAPSDSLADALRLVGLIVSQIVDERLTRKKQMEADQKNNQRYTEMGGTILFDNTKEMDKDTLAQYLAFPIVVGKIVAQMSTSPKLGNSGVAITALNAALHSERHLVERSSGANEWTTGPKKYLSKFQKTLLKLGDSISGETKPITAILKFVFTFFQDSKIKEAAKKARPKLKELGFDISMRADGPVHALSNDNITLAVEPYAHDFIRTPLPQDVVSLLLDEKDKDGNTSKSKLFQSANDVTVDAAATLRLHAKDTASLNCGKDEVSLTANSAGVVHLNTKAATAITSKQHVHVHGGGLVDIEGAGVMVGGKNGVSIGIYDDTSCKLSNDKPRIMVGQKAGADVGPHADLDEDMPKLARVQDKLRAEIRKRLDYIQKFNRLGGANADVTEKAKLLGQIDASTQTLSTLRREESQLLSAIRSGPAKVKAPAKDPSLILSNKGDAQKITLGTSDINITSKQKVVLSAGKTKVQLSASGVKAEATSLTWKANSISLG